MRDEIVALLHPLLLSSSGLQHDKVGPLVVSSSSVDVHLLVYLSRIKW